MKVNGEKMTDDNIAIKCEGEIILQVGKRRFARVSFS